MYDSKLEFCRVKRNLYEARQFSSCSQPAADYKDHLFNQIPDSIRMES